MPTYGPSEGEGEILFSGDNFREDFQGVEIGCKLGDSIGQGEIIQPGTIKCIVEDMALVDEGEGLIVSLALNSYSWVGGREGDILYRPYGILAVQPSSGPYEGFTDISITGRGFNSDYADKARCRFGVEANYVITDAEVLDYTKMICRSPEEFALPEGADEFFSVPFGIAFGDEEFKPWTLSTHRYRFYNQPKIEYAMPEEIRIGKFAEIYVYAYDDALFFERKSHVHLNLTLILILPLASFVNSTAIWQKWRRDWNSLQLRRLRHINGHVYQRNDSHVHNASHPGSSRGLCTRDSSGDRGNERTRFQRDRLRRLRDFRRHWFRQQLAQDSNLMSSARTSNRFHLVVLRREKGHRTLLRRPLH